MHIAKYISSYIRKRKSNNNFCKVNLTKYINNFMEPKHKYPIYLIDFKWSQAGKPEGIEYNPESNWFKGLPEGRFWNGFPHKFMLKEELTDAQLTIKGAELWTQYTTRNSEQKDIDNLVIHGRLVEHEEWCIQWFNHYTFDIGQTDEEVLQSFEEFVRRKEAYNQIHRNEYGEGKYCLMGAEDRWRWSGEQLKHGDYLPAPCRCEYCKEQGLIRINH